MIIVRIVRGIVAVLGGYAIMGLLITLVQETWLGGIGYTTSTTGVLLVGGFFTFLSAVAAGWLAGWIAGHHPVHHAAAMCLLVALETTWLVTSGRTHDPLWFDLIASGSLIAGLLIGASFSLRPRRPVAAIAG